MQRVALFSLWVFLLPAFIPATQWLINTTNRLTMTGPSSP